MASTPNTLRSHLSYEPRELSFGTSGRRGEVLHLSQLEVYINALAEVQYLQSLPTSEGGIAPGDEFYFAFDLRPSSSRYAPDQGGRGEICQAIELALRDAGMRPVNLGRIPTPALTFYAIVRGKGSIMVTGSHIPYDRNGYKLNTSQGELLKEHEGPINRAVQHVREKIYSQSPKESRFDARGFLKEGHRDLPAESGEAGWAYIERYLSFFDEGCLRGLRLVLYEHSAVGRDLLAEILTRLGAEVIAAGRSETFVPIDTENIDVDQLAVIQKLADEAARRHGRIDAVVSIDGDSDRPLVLGVDETSGQVRFFSGDLLGMIVAEFLKADAVVVPISCNDAVNQGELARFLEPKTRIGSPYVLAGMEKARQKGKQNICGWEANGGFLTGSDIRRGARTLHRLPTRDAVLPILSVLAAAQQRKQSLIDLFASLPKRFSRAALLRSFPRPIALEIVKRFSHSDPEIQDVVFPLESTAAHAASINLIRDELERFFPRDLGFGPIIRLNYTDGVRIWFRNGDVVHIRPSGNADEMRIYAVASTQERADTIARMGVALPDGILSRMRQEVAAE